MNNNDIDHLQNKVFQNKKIKGFNTKGVEIELLLITEELGELVRAHRRGQKKEVIEETVDIIIYCLGLLSILDVSASKEILKKIRKNEKRVYEKVSSEWGRKELK